MGFFDQIRTYVASSNMLLIEETPDIVRQSVINSITGNTDIATDLNNTILNSFSRKADRFYEYGRDHYYLGLPEGDLGREVPKYDEVNKILNKLYPQPAGYELRLTVASIEPAQLDFLGEMFVWNGGMSPFANTVSNQAYKDYQSSDPQEDTGTFLTFESSSWKYQHKIGPLRFKECTRVNNSTATLVIDYYFRTPWEQEGWSGDRKNFSTGFDLIISPSELYYHVEYTKRRISDNADMWGGKHKRWMYRINSHKYPSLDLESGAKINQYLPIVPLRVDNKDLMVPNNSAQYLTSKKILNYVDLDIKELREGINDNPDIDQIDHAYFTFGIGMRNREDWALKYIFWFFLDLAAKQSITKRDIDDWVNQFRIKEAAPYNLLTVTDSTYDMRYFWYYVDRVEHAGSIGPIGFTRINTSGDTGNFTNHTYKPNSSSDTRRWTQRSIHDKFYIDQQVETNRYIRLTVCGFTQWNRIYSTDAAVGTTVANKDNEEAFLPVNYSFLQELNLLDKNSFYYSSMRILINAYEKVKLEWYQTGFFKVVSKVIAVAITIWSAGGLSGISATLANLAAAGVVGIGIAIAEMILINIAISVTFQFVAEQLGLDVALIMAAVVAVAAMVGNMMPNLPMASDLLMLGPKLMDVANKAVSSAIEEVGSQIEDLTTDYEEQLAVIEAKQDEMDTTTLIDPMALYARIGMSPLDTASTYMQRTLLPNPGVMTLDTIGNFVSNSLQLPTKQY